MCHRWPNTKWFELRNRNWACPGRTFSSSIDPTPLAAGTIAQVHRATLTGGDRVVLKAQRPTAREEIEQDLALLKLFADRARERPALQKLIDIEAVFKHLSTSLHRELDFRQEASNIERMRGILKDYDRLDVPIVHQELSTSQVLVMEEIQGVPIVQAPEGPKRTEAARQLLESYYKQIIVDGFFHADPHPGNLKWWKDRVYFLDFGMVGDVGADLREHLMLLLMAFWQEDAGLLTDITLILANSIDRSDLDVPRLQAELGELMAKYRRSALAEIQIGVILQEMTEIVLRHGVPLPASLTLVGKALAQVQLSAVHLDPALDPFEIAGKFLIRSILKSVRSKLDPKTLLYKSQKLKVRAVRVIETFERLIGARPGQKLAVNFHATSLEDVVRQTGRRLALGLIAAASILAAGLAAVSTSLANWVPATFGVAGGLLTFGLIVDVLRRR